MSHLSADRLAALVDEAPTSAELAHLASCADCARERAAYSTLSSLARSEATRIGAPISAWERLAPVLVADGVIETDRGFRFRTRGWGRPWLQAAAAVLLVSSGMIAGRYSVGASVLPFGGSPPARATAVPSPDSVRLASVDEARALQARSQTLYQAATAFLAQHDSTSPAADTPSAMRTRLAALDRVRETMGQALDKAPYDPVINEYLLATIGQREATLRQLNTALPAGMRLTSY